MLNFSKYLDNSTNTKKREEEKKYQEKKQKKENNYTYKRKRKFLKKGQKHSPQQAKAQQIQTYKILKYLHEVQKTNNQIA